MPATADCLRLTDDEFDSISEFVRDVCGINLHAGKRELVQARLAKRVRALGVRSFGEYVDYVRHDSSGCELASMLDVLSTNLTSFFREPQHFEYLTRQFLPTCKAPRLRFWSAGCSSGEEPYSMGISLLEALAEHSGTDVRICATDLSQVALARARQGIYDAQRIANCSPQVRSKYFECVQTRPERMYRVCPQVRRLVTFGRLNLIDRWPMKGPFEVIFCRNVMIYFEKSTQARLIQRFHDLLGPGGLLCIGHSESLTGIRHEFQYIQPTIYRRQ